MIALFEVNRSLTAGTGKQALQHGMSYYHLNAAKLPSLAFDKFVFAVHGFPEDSAEYSAKINY